MEIYRRASLNAQYVKPCNSRSCQVLILSDKNKNPRLQFTWNHKIWAILDQNKTFPSLMIFFLNFCCNIWMVGPEFGIKNMDPSCFVPGGWRRYWNPRGTNKGSFKCHSLDIVTDHVPDTRWVYLIKMPGEYT